MTPASRRATFLWKCGCRTCCTRRAGTDELKSGSPTLIHFDSGPLRSRKDGSFETPQQLLTGSSYRITIHPEGGSVINSDWIATTTELTNAPPLRLRAHRKLIGLVQDRQGQPVSGARVALPSGSPTTATDTQGRFLLEGVLPERTYLLVAAPGFRFQGRPAVPAREPTEQKLVLVRTSEQPDRVLAPCLRRFRPRCRVHWRGACSSHTCNLH